MKWLLSDKYTLLRNELFFDREIRGLFGYRGGILSVNIDTEKMQKFRHRIYRTRRSIFTKILNQVIREENKKGNKMSQDDLEEKAYALFINYGDEHDMVLTHNRFKELYPEDSRRRISWTV
jgi:hypothetical protein